MTLSINKYFWAFCCLIIIWCAITDKVSGQTTTSAALPTSNPTTAAYSPASNALTYTYYGCFVEYPNPNYSILPGYFNYMEQNASAATCLALCQANNTQYNIFGLKTGNLCLCAENWDSFPDFKVDDSYCNTSCNGTGASGACGGNFQDLIQFASVYLASSNPYYQPSKSYVYYSCIVDNPNRTQSPILSDYSQNMGSNASIETCMNICLNQDLIFTLFGMGSGDMCYCSNNEATMPLMLTSPSMCQYGCQGNYTQACGGFIDNGGGHCVPFTSVYAGSSNPWFSWYVAHQTVTPVQST